MKIKIPANVKNEFSESGFKKTIENSKTITSNINNELKTNLLMISEYDNGEKILNQAINFQSNGENYISVLANPTHLFLKNAIDSYSESKLIELYKFPKCGKNNGGDIYFLEGEINYTHECFNDFLSNRISSIVMLVCSIENFINQLIPSDFKCFVNNQGKITNYKNAVDIEKSASFKNKVEQIIPQIINKSIEDFWSDKEHILNTLLELNNHRNKFIHLKTNSDAEWKRFSTVFADMVEFDLKNAIDKTILFFNELKPNHIEFDKEEIVSKSI